MKPLPDLQGACDAVGCRDDPVGFYEGASTDEPITLQQCDLQKQDFDVKPWPNGSSNSS